MDRLRGFGEVLPRSSALHHQPTGKELFGDPPEGGTILYYDGITWSAQASGIAVLLSGVWGSSATDVFAVVGGGGVLS